MNGPFSPRRISGASVAICPSSRFPSYLGKRLHGVTARPPNGMSPPTTIGWSETTRTLNDTLVTPSNAAPPPGCGETQESFNVAPAAAGTVAGAVYPGEVMAGDDPGMVPPAAVF